MAAIRMKRRDVLFSLIPAMIIGFVLLVSISLFWQFHSFKRIYMDDARRNLEQHTHFFQNVLAEDIAANQQQKINERLARYRERPLRITLMDAEGHVFAESDNDANSLDNHRFREEMQNATSNGIFVTRYSTTMKSTMLYHAIRLENGWVLRTSIPIDAVKPAYNQMLEAVLLSLALGGILVFAIIVYLFKRVRPDFVNLQTAANEIANGNLDVLIDPPRAGLLRELSNDIARMATQLKAQINDLKRLEQVRSEFIANVSHEIKTPLTAISSTVEMLTEMELSSDARTRCLDILAKQSRRLNNLVHDILSLAAIERRQSAISQNFERVSLPAVIDEAISYYKEEIDRAKITLNFQPFPLPNYEVMGEHRLLEHLFGNLINNALRYANATIFTITIAETKRHLKVAFSDNGCGIAEEHLPRLFERFYRVEKERSRATGGTGLGLAIVKHIAILHRGKVTVTSKLQQGTTFTLTLRKI